MTNTLEMPALPDDLFWRVRPERSRVRDRESTDPFAMRWIDSDNEFVVELVRKGSDETHTVQETKQELRVSYGIFGKRHESYIDVVTTKVVPKVSEQVLSSYTMEYTHYGTHAPDKTGWTAPDRKNKYDYHFSEELGWHYVVPVWWRKLAVLEAPQIAEFAEKCWERYISQQHEEALKEYRAIRFLGDYPPRKLS